LMYRGVNVYYIQYNGNRSCTLVCPTAIFILVFTTCPPGFFPLAFNDDKLVYPPWHITTCCCAGPKTISDLCCSVSFAGLWSISLILHRHQLVNFLQHATSKSVVLLKLYIIITMLFSRINTCSRLLGDVWNGSNLFLMESSLDRSAVRYELRNEGFSGSTRHGMCWGCSNNWWFTRSDDDSKSEKLEPEGSDGCCVWTGWDCCSSAGTSDETDCVCVCGGLEGCWLLTVFTPDCFCHCVWIGRDHADGGSPVDVFFTGCTGGRVGHSGPVIPSKSAFCLDEVVSKLPTMSKIRGYCYNNENG